MTDKEIFDAIRARKGSGLTQGEVAAINAIINPSPARASINREKFFAAVRASFGPLKQEQVDGFGAVLDAIEGLPLAHQAADLATAWHETAATMQPVTEAFWKSEDWRRKNLRYYPHHGRGYVQLTWPKNYARADAELDLGGTLIANPDRALEPQIAARIMRLGMEEGWFTGKKNSDYLPATGKATRPQFEQHRRVINGVDKAALIAGYALTFQDALS